MSDGRHENHLIVSCHFMKTLHFYITTELLGNVFVGKYLEQSFYHHFPNNLLFKHIVLVLKCELHPVSLNYFYI